MKAILSAMITCALLFGLSAGATKYLLESPEPPAEGEPQTSASPDEEAGGGDADAADPSMPVSFRPENDVSVEAVLQMSDSIKRMEQELAEREEKVKRDEMRVKLMFDDLATEQDQLKAFSEGIESKIEVASRLKVEVEQKLAELETRKAELEKLAKKTQAKQEDDGRALDDRVDDVKSWFSNLAPEQAAEYLREFSNNGKMAFAASLLQKMPDRQKSKILGAMNDPVLVDQLIESLTTSD